jgi:dTDP-4-dehydrorhamnose 3,5-epimerase
VNRDDRGSFTEIFYRSWNLCIDPTQWSAVFSNAGTLRGMHLHKRHDEYICVLKGRAFVGLLDIRPDSPTEGQSVLVEMTGEEMACLSFPRGVVHGWYFPEDSIHVQSVSEDYENYGHDDNLGCHWSDPDLGFTWPAKPTLVSARAEGFGTVAALRATMRSNG